MTKKQDAAQTSKTKLCAIDLFSGCGGLTLGLKQAGFEVLCAVELDATAARTFRANHPEVLLKEMDIRALPAASLKRELELTGGQLDLLAGCPPCQGFSALRTRNGANKNRDNRNRLLMEMLRFTRAFQPKAVMMENVPKLIGYRPFKLFCNKLKKLGYRLKFEVKDAACYGVPQRRRRLILLASRGFDIPFAPEARRSRTVRDTIANLPERGHSRDRLHNMPEKRRAPRITALIRDIPKDGGSRSDLPRQRQLSCHQRSDGFKDVYGRMAWDDVAPTITSGCFNPSKGRFLHPTKNRPITMREAALLQGFPRRYIFDPCLGKEAIALMIGNALPPEFIRRHASEIRRVLTT